MNENASGQPVDGAPVGAGLVPAQAEPERPAVATDPPAASKVGEVRLRRTLPGSRSFRFGLPFAAQVQRAGAAFDRLGWRARLPLIAVVLLGMALLPSIFAPETSLFGIPEPALVLFAVGLYIVLRLGLGTLGGALLAIVLAYYVDQLNSTQLNTVFIVALSALLGLGLNVVVGYAGLLDLGFVASLAIVLAALAGVLLGIPVLKLRGDYLAIVTLGFGEIIGRLSNNLTPLTGGAVGIYGIGAPAFLDFIVTRPLEQLVLLCLTCCFAVAFATGRLRDSRTGRAWAAIREDEDVAAAMGVNTVFYKLLAFGIGAAVGGLGGTIFAAQVSAISPPNFVLDLSIRVVSIIIIGGMGTIPGVVMGAIVLAGVPEVLRAIQEWRLVLYGALLVAMMVLRPEGLLPTRRRAMELHQPEAAPVVETAGEG
jgi:ABC-type branched-subunit amino acid transport system permease subunit